MNYEYMHKFTKIVLLAIILFLFVIYFIYNDNKKSEIASQRTHIEDVLMQVEAIRQYVSTDQRNEVYELQNEGKISHDYFTSALLSSTYSANKINEYYNEIRKSRDLTQIDIRFAAPNARNPKNLATNEEREILNKFINNEINRYESIKKSEDGDILYIAFPTRKLDANCMRCHSTPEAAPQQLVEKYGDKAGFGETLGGIKALISVEKPLKKAYENALKETLKAAFYIFIATLIFIYFYYQFNKKLYIKNEELEILNKNLDNKVKERTEELNNSKIQLLNVINSSELGYWDWEINSNQLHVNDIWLSMLGLSKKDFHNTTTDWIERIHPRDLKIIMPKIKKAFKENNSFSLEYRMKHSNGKYIWIEAVGGVVQRDENNEAIQACGIHRNIHNKKLNEQKMQEQEIIIHNQAKVSAVAEMLKNISHQWKQPLSIITTIASSIKLSYEYKQNLPEEKIIEYSDEILNNSNYLAKIINDFSSYFENNIQIKNDVSLENVFKKIIDLMKDSYEYEKIKIVFKIDNNYTIQMNENLFIQAILNIFNNSHDAFNIKNIDLDKRFVFIDIKELDSNIVITFKDSAEGIDENIINKIFEPYFTTKHNSLGTGIGLYMTNQIINKHLNGNIYVKNINYSYENKNLKGVEFKIILSSV